MKKILTSLLVCTLLGLAASQPVRATVFFTDNFSNGSTTNLLSIPGGTLTVSSTSYDFASSKSTVPSSTNGPNLLHCALTAATSSGYWEAQALFTTNTVNLNASGDYVEMAIVFTNTTSSLLASSACEIWIGLYSSGGTAGASNPPVAGALANAGLNTTTGSAYATGNCALWAGYACRVLSGAGSRIVTRPIQSGSGTTSANQELLGGGVSSGTYNNPGGTSATAASQAYTLPARSACTLALRITLDTNGSSLIISNTIYSGAGTGGGILMTNVHAVSSSDVVANAFDGLAFGAYNKVGGVNPVMDVSSITVSGVSSPPIPPSITKQPASVTVATNGACPFSVTAMGNGLTYQWRRNGTNLVTSTNLSGITSSTLVILSAGTAEEATPPNGYYLALDR